ARRKETHQPLARAAGGNASRVAAGAGVARAVEPAKAGTLCPGNRRAQTRSIFTSGRTYRVLMEMILQKISVLIITGLFGAADAASAQDASSAKISVTTTTGQQVNISEPASVKIEALFKQADLVAVLRIVSGDTEHYSTAIYKAVVVRGFKGTAPGEVIFFGPFIGYRLGDEYLAFLRRDLKPAEEKKKPSTPVMSYGPLRSSYSVMYDGYSTLPIEYTCAFDGETIAEQCDDGITLNIHQVILPNQIRKCPVGTLAEREGN